MNVYGMLTKTPRLHARWNPSEMGIEWHDPPPEPLKYQAHVNHVKLETVERLAELRLGGDWFAYCEYRSTLNQAFAETVKLHSDMEFHSLCLEEIDGRVYLAAGYGDNTIALKACDDKKLPEKLRLCRHPDYCGAVSYIFKNVSALLTLKHLPQKHRIKALRILPQQRQILVVREIAVSRSAPLTSIELIRLPEPKTQQPSRWPPLPNGTPRRRPKPKPQAKGKVQRNPQPPSVAPVEQYIFEGGKVTEVHITDPGTPNWFDAEVQDYSRGENPGCKPVSILMKFTQSRLPGVDAGIARLTLHPFNINSVGPSVTVPRRKTIFTIPPPDDDDDDNAVIAPPPPVFPGARPVWKYTLHHCRPVKISDVSNLGPNFHILAHSRRPLLYTTASSPDWKQPVITSVHRYHDPDMYTDTPGPKLFERVSADGRSLHESAAENSVEELCFPLREDDEMKVLAFDEVSGRLLYSIHGETAIGVVEVKTPRMRTSGTYII